MNAQSWCQFIQQLRDGLLYRFVGYWDLGEKSRRSLLHHKPLHPTTYYTSLMARVTPSESASRTPILCSSCTAAQLALTV